MKIGRIPEKMKAYLKDEKEMLGDGTPRSWWGFPPDRRETPGFAKFKACPAFVVPADSEAFNKSAMIWATEYGTSGKPGIVEFDNKPMDSLRWVGIDSRMEGGVAYKVVTPQGWLVDLREDVVTECLFEGAISHYDMAPLRGTGTYFTGGFVWVVMGSQSRIVRVNSKVYREIAESMKLKAMKPLSDKEMEVGGVYRDARGDEVVLAGRGKGKDKYITMRSAMRWTGSPPNMERVPVPHQENMDIAVRALSTKCFPNLHISGSLKVIERVGSVSVPDGFAEAYLKKVEAARKENERQQREYYKQRGV